MVRRPSLSSDAAETIETVTPYDESQAREVTVTAQRQVAMVPSGAVGVPVAVSSALYKDKRDVRRTDALNAPEVSGGRGACAQTWEYRKIKISDLALISGIDIQEPTINSGVYHKEGFLFLQGRPGGLPSHLDGSTECVRQDRLRLHGRGAGSECSAPRAFCGRG